MNTNNVKKYAPKARKAFIEAMSKQAAKYGITKKKIEPAEQKGDLALIGDRPFPASVIKPRERLVKRIEQQGFDQVMEHVAYSWFNRLCAIRYMERKGFIDHGRRVLSAAGGSAGVPQILEECLDVELPGLDQAKVRELKLDGTKDEELYRELLLAQCHALHQAMPFLFEAIADESELLLPENLTKTDSLIRDLVVSVPDEDWDHIEIIGWLYQFYISEKKDQVMGKVVKSEDIPAATQLFTPNWIVQYLVQNSVGRQWLQTYPDSPLKGKMPYYIEPAEQTPEVLAQLAAMTPPEIAPESIKVLDPACGSGHILVEAYKVLKAIYEERGYRTRDIPQLILKNNLFGLDIDDRAGQLAGFALMMLAREDDRRIFSRNIRLNVLSLQESANVNLPSLWQSLNLTGEWKSGTSQSMFRVLQQDLGAFTADNRYQLIQRTLERFKQAKTLGSLIDVPHNDYQGLKELFFTLCELESSGDSMQKSAAGQLLPYLHQSVILSKKYDAVVANPPYMGRKGMNSKLKDFAKIEFPKSKSDLFAIFMERALNFLNQSGFNAQINMQSWMFLSSYEKLRKEIIEKSTFVSLVHLGSRAFSQISGEVVQTVAWVIQKCSTPDFQPVFFRLTHGNEFEKMNMLLVNESRMEHLKQGDFARIPGSPIAYWIDEAMFKTFIEFPSLSEFADIKGGMNTGNNEMFLRYWHEICLDKFTISCNSHEETSKEAARWFPYNKGGDWRKWYGNRDLVVNWKNKGEDIHRYNNVPMDYNGAPVRAKKYQFKESITWSDIAINSFAARYSPPGSMFDVKGSSGFPKNGIYQEMLALMCSPVIVSYMNALNPSVTFQVGDIGRVPFPKDARGLEVIRDSVDRAIEIAKEDWDSYEVSFEFVRNLLVSASYNLISDALNDTMKQAAKDTRELLLIENENNTLLCNRYGLDCQLVGDVPISEITLVRNLHYRYAIERNESHLDDYISRQKSDYLAELLSYSLGCMMGRYSLDREGLVYAHSRSEVFSDLIADGAYKTFPADDDGIIPLTDQEWFLDDATNRFREFVNVVWGEDNLQENLDFVAESLCLHAIKPKKSESSMDTIRRYLSTQFYKDHLKAYKKRPIYWLFSSGKQKAFECLVYLHRYNEGTLARMRTEYVIPLTAKMAAYAQKLENDKEASGSAAEVKRLEKEIVQLHKQQAELSEFDEKLRHYADQRISLDLDDGVKVNYGKFGDLLAEVKAITGEKPEVNI